MSFRPTTLENNTCTSANLITLKIQNYYFRKSDSHRFYLEVIIIHVILATYVVFMVLMRYRNAEKIMREGAFHEFVTYG